jgi:hypothetical protein
MTKRDAGQLWQWLERIREYLTDQGKWRDIDEEKWKLLSLHLLERSNK